MTRRDEPLDYALPPETDPVDDLALDVQRLRGAVLRLAWIGLALALAQLAGVAAFLWWVAP